MPVVVLQSRRLEQRIAAVADALTATPTELPRPARPGGARSPGALTGPWRPTNGSPAAASKGSPEATAE